METAEKSFEETQICFSKDIKYQIFLGPHCPPEGSLFVPKPYKFYIYRAYCRPLLGATIAPILVP